MRQQRGFTLVELLAVMAIIGILAGVTAGAISGLGGQGINAQIASDANAIGTAADRFLNATFPETLPVSALPSGEKDLGVREINFDAALPQDPSKTFVPDFLKKIPDSAALVSFRIDEATGNVFTADDGAAFAPPPDSRLDASLSDTLPSGNPELVLTLKMGKDRAAVEELRIQGPGGVVLGGASLPADSIVGKVEITFGTDNPWRSGQEINLDTDIVATGRAFEWEIKPDYSKATSGAGVVTGVREGVTSLTHTLDIAASGTLGVLGKLFLVMDRTDPKSTKAHNEATETWVLTIFKRARDSAGEDIIPEEKLITNPSQSRVYRWLTDEHSTIQVEDIFVPVAGRLAVVIKDVGSSTGGILGTTPNVVSVTAPASVVEGANESDTDILAFSEAQGIALPANFLADITSAGVFQAPGFPSPVVLIAATVVNSHLLHFDPIGSGPAQTNVGTFTSGSVTFNSDIIAIILRSANLDASDALLGVTGTSYASGGLRGLENNTHCGGTSIGPDQITLESDLRTVTVVQYLATCNVDQIRVLTK